MTKRYGVVPTFDGRRTVSPFRSTPRFRRLAAAVKERDRLTAANPMYRVESPADILRRGKYAKYAFSYRWRVWDYANKRYADGTQ